MPLPGGVGGDGAHLTKHQSDPQTDQMSCWPAVVPLLTSRCLDLGWGCQGANRGCRGIGGIGGYIWKMKMVYCKVLLKTQDGLLQTIEHELRSMGPKLVPLLAARCLYWGMGGVSNWRSACLKGWPNVKLTWDASTNGVHLTGAKRTSENFNTLVVWGLASQRSFLRKTNN